jgi:hypothetical protein
MLADLAPEDRAAIADLLRDRIAADKYHLFSPRIQRLREILHKLGPPGRKPFRFPPLRQGQQSHLRRQARR